MLINTLEQPMTLLNNTFKNIKQRIGQLVIISMSFGIFGVYASEATPNWYLNFDVQGLRNSEIIKQKSPDERKALKLMDLLMGKSSAKLIEHASAFGFSENEKILILSGKFQSQQSAILQQWQRLGFESKSSYQGTAVYQSLAYQALVEYKKLAEQEGLIGDDQEIDISPDDKDQQTIVYAAFNGQNQVIFSDSQNTLQRQLSDKATALKSNNDSIFEVIVDVKKALLHGGVNLDEMEQDSVKFESISAKQLSQFSVSYSEQGNYSSLQLGLKADTQDVANSIKAIVQGIVAMKRLSTSDAQVIDLLNNIRFEQSGGDLLMTVAGSADAFIKLTDDRE